MSKDYRINLAQKPNSLPKRLACELRPLTTKRNDGRLTVKLTTTDAKSLAFLLKESYSHWEREIDCFAEDIKAGVQPGEYPHQAMRLLDIIDVVRDQLEAQGIEWM